MGRYDGILIVSDWDNTVSKGGSVPEKTREAIRKYQSEGGRFTVCSGRNATHFDKFREDFIPNAPICAYNGALIIDTDGRILRESFLDTEVLGVAKTLLHSGLLVSVAIHAKELSGPHHCDIEEFTEQFDKYTEMHHYKIVFVGRDEDSTLSAKRLAESLLPEGYSAARSWPVGLEIFKSSASKGEALKLVKAYTSSTIVIGVGDFENDIDLIAAADIGYAVDNALPSVKAAADRVTVSVSESAIAKIIEEISI